MGMGTVSINTASSKFSVLNVDIGNAKVNLTQVFCYQSSGTDYLVMGSVPSLDG